jgi:hypothetical protein
VGTGWAGEASGKRLQGPARLSVFDALRDAPSEVVGRQETSDARGWCRAALGMRVCGIDGDDPGALS